MQFVRYCYKYSRPKYIRLSPIPKKKNEKRKVKLCVKGKNIIAPLTTFRIWPKSHQITIKTERKLKTKKKKNNKEEEIEKPYEGFEFKIIEPIKPPYYNFLNQMKPKEIETNIPIRPKSSKNDTKINKGKESIINEIPIKSIDSKPCIKDNQEENSKSNKSEIPSELKHFANQLNFETAQIANKSNGKLIKNNNDKVEAYEDDLEQIARPRTEGVRRKPFKAKGVVVNTIAKRKAREAVMRWMEKNNM